MEWMSNMNGAIIKQLREAKAWSQEQLAAHSGLSLRTIQRIEAEGRGSLDTQQALAAVFGVEVAALSVASVDAPRGFYLQDWQYRLLRLLLVVAVLAGVDLYRHGALTWSRWVLAGFILMAALRWLKKTRVR
jgi:transcriptional regulator with XRE-family HTH domain